MTNPYGSSGHFIWNAGRGRWPRLQGALLCGVAALALDAMPLAARALLPPTNVNSAGSGFSLDGDGTVWAWGYNDHGQLGDGTTQDRPSPVQVQIGP
jgi:hypothetical protein